MSGHLFERRHYNALAAIMSDILHNTKEEHIPVVTSAFMRMANGIAMRSSNMQMSRFMTAAGLTDNADTKLTKRY